MSVAVHYLNLNPGLYVDLHVSVCALALRYCTKTPHLHEFTMDVVRDAITGTLENCLKTIETCQAYILLALYPVPQKKWTEDRRWLIVGVAVV